MADQVEVHYVARIKIERVEVKTVSGPGTNSPVSTTRKVGSIGDFTIKNSDIDKLKLKINQHVQLIEDVESAEQDRRTRGE